MDLQRPTCYEDYSWYSDWISAAEVHYCAHCAWRGRPEVHEHHSALAFAAHRCQWLCFGCGWMGHTATIDWEVGFVRCPTCGEQVV